MQKRVLAFLMVVAMVFSLLPVTVVTAEGEEATAGYTLTLQKAHNQAEGSLAVDVYLQANIADQAAVTGYGFTVTPAEGLALNADIVDHTGNDAIVASGPDTTDESTENDRDYTVIYSPTEEKPITVVTSRVLVATFTIIGETIPATWTDAFTVSNCRVATAEVDADGNAIGNYTPVLKTVAYACTDHTCGHGTGEWTPVTTADLSGKTLESGNYYLVGDINATAQTKISAADAQVNICLNGYTWTCSVKQMISISAANATVNICDCTAAGTGTDLVAGKIVPQVYNWGSLRVSGANTTLNVSNVIIEGAEDALSTSVDDANVGNAAAFYSSSAAVGSLINVENVLIRDMNSEKTVVDIRGGGVFKNVVFQNCSGGQNEITTDTHTLGIFATNGSPKDPNPYLTIEDCQFIDCTGPVLDTQETPSMTFTLKGNVQADGVFYVSDGDKLTLELGSEARVYIQTETTKSAETLGDAVAVVETLPVNTLFYANANDEVITYNDGVFSVNSHVHEDGYAGVESSETWKPWYDAASLPDSGNYYLATDVILPSEAEPHAATAAAVNICLNGHTVDGSAAKRVYMVYSHTVTFCDCKGHADPDEAGTLIGSNTSNGGSVFRVRGRTVSGTKNYRGGYLWLYDIKMTSNSTNMNSAIYMEHTNEANTTSKDATLYMEGVEAYGFYAYRGGVVRVYSSTTENTDNTPTITIKGCDFHHNSAASSGYGAVLSLLKSPNVTIEDTQFHDNSSEATGGAIRTGSGGTLTITNCTFTNNSAATTGGALECPNTNAEITINNSTFTGNRAVGVGGALRSAGANTQITINNSTFTGNTSGSGGGAIYTVTTGNTLRLNNCKIYGNTDKLGGGGVYMTSKNSNLILSGDTVIAGNSCTNGGIPSADLFYQTGTTDATLWTNPLIQVDELGSGAHINAYYARTDAAVNVLASTTDADGVTTTEDANDASELVAIAEGGTQTPFCGLISYANSESGPVRTVSYLNLTGDATAAPAFIYGHYHKDANGNYYELTAWTATDSLPNVNPTAEDGTALHGYYLANDVTTSAMAVIANNTELYLCMNGRTVTQTTNSKGEYARAYRIASGSTGAELTLEDCTTAYDENGHYISGGKFDGYTLGGNGAVLQFYAGTAKVSGIAFTNGEDTQTLYYNCANTTRGYGGAAIQTRGSNSLTLNIDGCKFANNVSGSDGGALSCQSGHIQISNSVFEGNESNRSGGAIMTAGTSSRLVRLDLTNCKFEDNHTYGTPTEKDATTTLANTARGGAVYTVYTAVNITDCEFTGNTAGCKEGMTTADGVGLGGAIMVLNPGADNDGDGTADGLTVTNTSFDGNIAETNGGAVYEDGISVTATNCTADSNSAGQGGVFYVDDGAELTIHGGTYTNNSATKTGNSGGGAVCTYGDAEVTVDLYNGEGAVFRKNTAEATGGAFLLKKGAAMTMDGATIEDNSAAHGAAMGLWGTVDAVLNDTTVQYNKSNSTAYGNVFFGGTGNSDECRLTVSGVTVIDNNTNADGTVECNIVFRDNISPLMLIGDGGLEAGSSIGVDARSDRFNAGYFHITGGLGDMDPTQYFSSDNSKYGIAKVNGYLPTYYSGTAKPTTHEAGIEAEAAVAAAQAKLESGEYYQIFTATSAEIAADDTNEAKAYTYLTGYVADDTTAAVNYLRFVAAQVDGQYHDTVQEAIDAAAGTTNVVKLQGNAGEVTASDNVIIDLNGKNIEKITVADNKTLSLIDSKTNDYDVADGVYGTATVAGSYNTYVEDSSTGSLKRYLVVAHETDATAGTATVSAHRVYLAINKKVLRTYNEGLGFGAFYAGDQVIAEQIASGNITFGILLSGYENFEEDQAYLDAVAADPDAQAYSVGEFGTGFAAGKGNGTPNQKTAVITGVLMADADSEEDLYTKPIYGRPYIAMGDTVVTNNTSVSVTMDEMVQAGLATDLADAVNAMLAKYGDTYTSAE